MRYHFQLVFEPQSSISDIPLDHRRDARRAWQKLL